MRIVRIIIALTILVYLLGCTLDINRDNPLDPFDSGEHIPDEVVITTLPNTSIGSVNLQWELQNDAAGYLVYRSLSYNGVYTQIADITFEENDYIGSYEDYEDLISETWYYYKVSAYSINGLEGYRSQSTYTYFIDESN